MKCRPMQEADLLAVMDIECRITPFPWTVGNFSDSLIAGHSAWVGIQNEKIGGYAVMSMGADEAELLTIGVDSVYQRCGWGGSLMKKLLQIAQNQGVLRLFLEVRRSNVSARAFYNQLNFDEVGLRRDYYSAFEHREDAIVMVKNL